MYNRLLRRSLFSAALILAACDQNQTSPVAEMEQAVTRLEDALAVDGSNPKEAPLAEAVAEFTELTEAARDALRTTSEASALGDRHFSKGNFKEAIDAYKKASQQNSNDAVSQFMIGCAEFELGRFDAAREAFLDTKHIVPSARSAVSLVGWCQSRINAPDKPILAEGVRLLEGESGFLFGPQEKDPVIRAIFGRMTAEMGPRQRDEEALRRYANKHPNDVRIQLGVTLTEPVVGHKRLENLRQLYQRFPDEPLMWAAWVQYLIAQERSPETSLQVLEKWTRAEPENAFPRYQKIFLKYRRSLANYLETMKAPPLPEEDTQALFALATLPIYESYLANLLNCEAEILRATGHAFHIHVRNNPTGIPGLRWLAQGLQSSHEELIDNKRLEDAIDLQRKFEPVVTRWALGNTSRETLGFAVLKVTCQPIVDHLKAQEDYKRAESFATNYLAMRPSDEEIDIGTRLFNLALLPLPSVVNEVSAELTLNERELIRKFSSSR